MDVWMFTMKSICHVGAKILMDMARKSWWICEQFPVIFDIHFFLQICGLPMKFGPRSQKVWEPLPLTESIVCRLWKYSRLLPHERNVQHRREPNLLRAFDFLMWAHMDKLSVSKWAKLLVLAHVNNTCYILFYRILVGYVAPIFKLVRKPKNGLV